jgi:adenylate cyclase
MENHVNPDLDPNIYFKNIKMQKESKRKFLVENLSVLDGHQGFPIVQGYLFTESALAEVRTFGSFAFLSIQGIDNGSDRKDFEYPIPLEDAMAMLECHCSPRIIRKTRHLIPYGNVVLEVDRFNGKLDGLVIAEIAPDSQSGAFDLPDWIGPEVTGDPSFGDFALAHAELPPGATIQA